MKGYNNTASRVFRNEIYAFKEGKHDEVLVRPGGQKVESLLSKMTTYSLTINHYYFEVDLLIEQTLLDSL